MRTCLLLAVALAAAAQPNPDRKDWIQLFNGRDLRDWKPKITGHDLGDNFANTFRVENGVLKVSYDGYQSFSNKFGHIFYKDRFSHYIVAVEYRFVGEQVAGGPSWALRNSGIMLHCQPPETMRRDQDFPISIEVQLLGGSGTGQRTTGNLCTPGTNVVMSGKLVTQHCINSSSKTYHGEQWVRAEVEVHGDGPVKHIINGETVLSYEQPQIGGGAVNNFDPAVKQDGRLLGEGYISLQSESHPIEFRKVELLSLAGCTDRKAANWKSYYVKSDNSQCQYVLTPKPGAAAKVNGPKVYGARPGSPFLYRIPATGERPMRFAASGLPSSLRLDAAAGIISGNAPARRGEYKVALKATNARGSSSRPFKIVVGDTLALTPPMGWNHWYTHYHRITDTLMREAADVMVSSGMADAGYQYVSIDDCWMRKPDSTDPMLAGELRGPGGALLPNGHFPDMKGLTDYVHSRGLKAGIYTSPGPLTCARYAGSYEHEEADARQFAAWGFDLLKYDWCSYRKVAANESLEERKKPYAKMGAMLRALDRDVIFNLCQYGMSDVWKWGGEVGGHSWRTTGDVGLEKADRLPGFYRVGLFNAKLSEFAAPGRWNDPDYLIIGNAGDARNINAPPRPTPLTGDEQYSYMSMWSLMAAPLFFSGEMGSLDEFTLNILTNGEVIDVNQDVLGKQARIVRQTDEELVLAKPLEDGALAVGLFNLGDAPRPIRITAPELGWKGSLKARDLWRQQDLPAMGGEYQAEVPRHGVVLLRMKR